jgi:hypothetical protein
VRGTWQTTGGGGSGGLVLAAVVAVVLVGSGAASAIGRALVTILIVVGCAIALAAVAGVAWLVHLARRNRVGRPISARPVYHQLPPDPRPQLEGSREPAIGPAREIHLHLHGLTPDQIAAIVNARQGIQAARDD